MAPMLPKQRPSRSTLRRLGLSPAMLVCILMAILGIFAPTRALYRRSEMTGDQESWMVGGPQEENPEAATISIEEAKRRAAEEEEEIQRQVHIEKFKRTLLQRLHLTSPPQFTRPDGTVGNHTRGKRLLRALPLALQGRLLRQMQAEQGAVEPPADRTDERETLILLKNLHWKLPKVSSAGFAIDMADEIDPTRIQSALLQFETKHPLMKGQYLELWEVFMTPKEDEEEMSNDMMDHLIKHEQYNNLSRLFEKRNDQYTSLPAPTVVRDPRDSSKEYRSVVIRIRPGRLAETVVVNRPGSVQVTFDISAAFAQWMAHKRRMPLMRKLIRSIVVVCPKCESRVDPVDVNKGILEIRHRIALRRTRRSLDSNGSSRVAIGNPCDSNGHKFSCCTQPFSFNFEDVGWHNWILHPKDVQPNYCHGSCQAEGIKKTPHSDLMHMYRSQKFDILSEVQKEAMLSCCHPVKMASTSVLYVDPNNELRMDTLHNIIVLECGCS